MFSRTLADTSNVVQAEEFIQDYQMVVLSGDYDITITSSTKQEMQCAIEIGNTIYSFESDWAAVDYT